MTRSRRFKLSSTATGAPVLAGSAAPDENGDIPMTASRNPVGWFFGAGLRDQVDLESLTGELRETGPR